MPSQRLYCFGVWGSFEEWAITRRPFRSSWWSTRKCLGAEMGGGERGTGLFERGAGIVQGQPRRFCSATTCLVCLSLTSYDILMSPSRHRWCTIQKERPACTKFLLESAVWMLVRTSYCRKLAVAFRSTTGAGRSPWRAWRQIWGRSTWAMELGSCHSARKLHKLLGCDWDWKVGLEGIGLGSRQRSRYW